MIYQVCDALQTWFNVVCSGDITVWGPRYHIQIVNISIVLTKRESFQNLRRESYVPDIQAGYMAKARIIYGICENE